jgi:ribosomal protein L22
MTEKPRDETDEPEVPESPEEAVEAAEAAAEIAESAAADAADAETPDEAAEAAEVAQEAAEVAADAAEIAEAAEGAEADAEVAAEEAEEAAAEAPKPKRTRRKKADAEPADEEPVEATKAAKKRGPRRGSADVAAKKQRSRRPRPDAEPVFVRAQAKYVRSSPRKARLVVDHIRGKSVDEARAILAHTPRAAAVPASRGAPDSPGDGRRRADPQEVPSSRAGTGDQDPQAHQPHHHQLDKQGVTHGSESPSRVDASRLHPRLEVVVVQREAVLGVPHGGPGDP